MGGKSLSSWKWWIGGAGLVLVVLLVGAWYFIVRPTSAMARSESEKGNGPTKITVETARPQKGGMQRTTTQPGSVQSFESAELYAGVSGYLKSQSVDIGDRVQRGQVLAVVDVPDLEKQVQQHEAKVEEAKARVEQMDARVASSKADVEAAKAMVNQAESTIVSAKANLRFREYQFTRMQQLLDDKSIDARLVDEKQEQRDAALAAKQAADAAVVTAKAQVTAAEAKVRQAEADVTDAKAQVKVAQAELEKAQVLVAYATIKSPYDGVITQRSFFPGDFVRSANEGVHAPLLKVERTDKMRVVVQVPDRDVPFCDCANPAEVELDALPGTKIQATVSRKANSEDPQTRLMRVEVDIPNPTGKIAQGMYGNVTIILDQGTDLLSVPSSCLVGQGENGKAELFVVRDGKARRISVSSGADNGLRVAILKGLKADDEVIVHPGSALTDGLPVNVAPPAPKAAAH
jgi:RND family efflux transporter MFP subunit